MIEMAIFRQQLTVDNGRSTFFIDLRVSHDSCHVFFRWAGQRERVNDETHPAARNIALPYQSGRKGIF